MTELAHKIAELHKTKSILVEQVSKIQVEISELAGEQKKAKARVLNETMGELGRVNEEIKSYNVLHRSTKEQKLLKALEKEYPVIYANLYAKC